MSVMIQIEYMSGIKTGTRKVNITPCRKEIPAMRGLAYLEITVSETSIEEAPAIEMLP